MSDVKEVNTQTGEITYRNFTQEELASNEFVAQKIANEKAKQLEAVTQRQALLDKLGITEDEARLLLGGN